MKKEFQNILNSKNLPFQPCSNDRPFPRDLCFSLADGSNIKIREHTNGSIYSIEPEGSLSSSNFIVLHYDGDHLLRIHARIKTDEEIFFFTVAGGFFPSEEIAFYRAIDDMESFEDFQKAVKKFATQSKANMRSIQSCTFVLDQQGKAQNPASLHPFFPR